MTTLEATPLTFTCPHCKSAVDVVPEHGTELVTCPNCTKPFQIKVPTATQEPPHVEVPEDIRRVEESPARNTDSATAETAEPAQVREAFASQREKDAEPVFSVTANLFRRYPGRVLLYGAIIVTGIYLLFDSIGGQYLFEMIAGIVMIGWGMIRMVAWHWRGSSTTLTVTHRSIVINAGGADAIELMMEDIQSVQAVRSISGRVLGVGDLGIVTRGNLQNFLIRGVPDPESVVEAWRSSVDVAHPAPAAQS